ncbi:hypothetical protein M9Y10_034875 [Tritrichomonas musculus]|uniref:mitogen-activated protein kinase kinase n=1 Tax=Tritrichomonas musculus TaxID=1915356 RepID=A0ABR2KG78_9EUKA
MEMQENKNSITTASQNKKDDNDEKNRQQEREIEQLKEKNRQQEREIEQLKEKNRQQEREIEQLKEKNDQQISRMEEENSRMKEQIIRLEEENERLKKESSKSKAESDNKTRESKAFKILGENEIKDLEKIDELGSGGGGKVFKVFKKKLYALKEMNAKNSNSDQFQQFINEYEIMNMLDHANILKAYGIFLSNEKIPPSILLEYCPQNLLKGIEDKFFSKEELVKIIYQIAEGMKYIHFKKVIHRDLKPTNILIMSDGTVKICDFGISKLMTIEEQTMTRGLGSQKFMAPEIINEEDYYDEKVDVYSFGVLVFFIMTGGVIPKIKLGDILKGKKADIPSSFTEFAKKLISDCWNFEPKDRPSFKDIVDDLDKNHYNLFQLERSEVKNIESFVKQHKEKLPKY